MPRFDLESYETVDQRIQRFYREHPQGRIETDVVSFDGEHNATRWVVKAKVYRDSFPETLPAGEGHAFEIDGGGGANKTSALENGETSAVGRALAQAGFSGSKRTTREEMMKVKGAEIRERIAAAQSVDELKAIHTELSSDGIAKEFIQELSDRKKALNG